MGQPASLNNRGFTLVEMLVAMVIMLVLLLSLVQAALLSIDGNMRNLLRDEGVRITEQRMNELRSLPFDDEKLAATTFKSNCPTVCPTVSRNFRNLTKAYTFCWQATDLSSDVKRLDVVVGWNHKSEIPPNQRPAPTCTEYQHRISSILRR